MEIASKIMTLIEESEKTLIIVSPYLNIEKWDKMKNCLRRAIERNVEIKLIVRKNADNNLKTLLEMKLKIFYVENLHAKVYLNEKNGIVTSQNMIHYSDNYSLDIGYKTESKNELDELNNYISHYLINDNNEETNNVNKITNKKSALDEEDIEYLYELLSQDFSKVENSRVYIWSNALIPSAEIFIKNDLTIKVFKKNKIHREQLKWLDDITINDFNYKYERYIDKEKNKNYIYYSFLPNEDGNVKKLHEDYKKLIKIIISKMKEGIRNA